MIDETIIYREIPSEYNFNTEFPTYVIGFCPDTNDLFVTNKRFWYAQYKKEFDTEEEGIAFIKEHAVELLDWKNQFGDFGFPNTLKWFCFANTNNVYDAENGWQQK